MLDEYLPAMLKIELVLLGESQCGSPMWWRRVIFSSS